MNVEELKQRLPPILEAGSSDVMSAEEVERAYEEQYGEKMGSDWKALFQKQNLFGTRTIQTCNPNNPQKTLLFKPTFLARMRSCQDEIITEELLRERLRTITKLVVDIKIQLPDIAKIYDALYGSNLSNVIESHFNLSLLKFYEKHFKITLTAVQTQNIGSIFPAEGDYASRILTVAEVLERYQAKYDHSLLDILSPFAFSDEVYPWQSLERVKEYTLYTVDEKNMQSTNNTYIIRERKAKASSSSEELVNRVRYLYLLHYPYYVSVERIERLYDIVYGCKLSNQVKKFLQFPSWKESVDQGYWDVSLEWETHHASGRWKVEDVMILSAVEKQLLKMYQPVDQSSSRASRKRKLHPDEEAEEIEGKEDYLDIFQVHETKAVEEMR